MPATADVSLPEQVDRYAEAVRGEIGVLDPLALDVGGSDHGPGHRAGHPTLAEDHDTERASAVLTPHAFNHCRTDPDNELSGPDDVLRFARPLYGDPLSETRQPIADGSASRSGKVGLVRAKPTWTAFVAVARPHTALRAQFHAARTLPRGRLAFRDHTTQLVPRTG
jgi:hypothetical protein